MGLTYDQYDTVPTNATEMCNLQGYTTGPVWSGAEASTALQNANVMCPPGAICCEVDVSRFTQAWYNYITSVSFTSATTVNVAIGNMYSPVRLVCLTDEGPATAVNAGKILVQYEIELIEPVTSALNL